MKILDEPVEDFTGLSAGSNKTATKFVTKNPTKAITLYVDRVVTSGTALGGAYTAEAPGNLLEEIEMWINGKTRGTIAGRDLWDLMRLIQGVEPEYNFTTWAISTVLTVDAVFRIDFHTPIPAGVAIAIRFKIGTVASIVTGGSHTETSCVMYVRQETMVFSPFLKRDMEWQEQIRNTTICDSWDKQTHPQAGTVLTFNDQSMNAGGVVRKILFRQRDNSILINTLITMWQVEYEHDIVLKEKRGEQFNSDWTKVAGLQKPLGKFIWDLDPDKDGDGFLGTALGKPFILRLTHGAVTGTADVDSIQVKSVDL